MAPSLKETFEVPMRVGSSSSLHGSSSDCLLPYLSLGVLTRGLSWLPLPGFDFAGLVVWLLLAPRSWEPPSWSTLFSRSVTFWSLCGACWSPPLFPCSLWRALAYGLAAWPLPHSRWSRVHGRASAGLSSVSDRSWCYRASWFAQGCVPLLRPFALLAL